MTTPLSLTELPLADGTARRAAELKLSRRQGFDTTSGVLTQVARTAQDSPERAAVVDGGQRKQQPGLRRAPRQGRPVHRRAGRGRLRCRDGRRQRR